MKVLNLEIDFHYLNMLFNRYFLRSPRFLNKKHFCSYFKKAHVSGEYIKKFFSVLKTRGVIIRAKHPIYQYGRLPVKLFSDIPAIASIDGGSFGPAKAGEIVYMPPEHALLFLANKMGIIFLEVES